MIRRPAVVNFGSDYIFLERFFLAFQCAFHCKSQKTAEALGLQKDGALQYSLKFLANSGIGEFACLWVYSYLRAPARASLAVLQILWNAQMPLDPVPGCQE